MTQLPEQITTIADIQALTRSGFDDWKQYGEVGTDTNGDLILFNYTPKAQYEARWNYFERVSRGLIVNRITGEVAARAFDKFFNWGERGSVSGGRIVSITEKIDGSLGVLYRQDGYNMVATRGSFTGEQATWATQYLSINHPGAKFPDHITPLFEIVYPDNRIVVDYGDLNALVLLAARNRFTGEYLPFYPDVFDMGKAMGFVVPTVYTFDGIDSIIRNTKEIDANHEGYVVEFSDGQRLKFKGDRYVELHKLISGLSFKNTVEAAADGTVDFIRSQIPDEFLGQFNGWVNDIESTVSNTRRRVDAAFDAAPKDSRKEFALWVRANYVELAPYLFHAFDGHDYTPNIYKLAFK